MSLRTRIFNLDIFEYRTQRSRIRDFVSAAPAPPAVFDEIVDGDSAAGWGGLLETIYEGSDAPETAYAVLLDGGDALIT
jgi:hypothetical protein